MTQRRRRARLKRGQVDAELIEAGGLAKALAQAAGNDLLERLRIGRPAVHRQLSDVDLGHGAVAPFRCRRLKVVGLRRLTQGSIKAPASRRRGSPVRLPTERG